MAINPLNVVLGQLPQPLGASHAQNRTYEPDKDDEFLPTRGEAQEEKPTILGIREIVGSYRLGGYMK